MQIKAQLGKLRLNLPLAELVESQRETNEIEVLPISLEHILELENLPVLHNDPFDRLLIARANIEHATIVTADAIFAKYPIKVAW